jgi:hypothetical protein
LYEQATIVEVSNFGKKFKEDKQEVNTWAYVIVYKLNVCFPFLLLSVKYFT